MALTRQKIEEHIERLKKAGKYDDTAKKQMEEFAKKRGISTGSSSSSGSDSGSNNDSKNTNTTSSSPNLRWVTDGSGDRRLVDTNTGKVYQSSVPGESTVNGESTGLPTSQDEVTTPTNQSGSGVMDKVKELAELQRQQRIRQIEESRKRALGMLDEEESRVEPVFSAQRRGVRSSGRESARTLEEYLAQRGLQNSGAMAEGQMRQAQTTRSGLSQLGQQQAQVESDIARRRSDVESGALQDMNMAQLQAQEDVMRSAIGQAQQQQQFDFQREMGDINFQRQLMMNNLNYEQQRQMQEMSNQQQMDYLDRQNQLMIERERGNMTPLQFYEEKLKLQQQYAPKGSSSDSYSDSDIRQQAMVGSAIDNRLRSNDYLGAYKVYEANKDLASQLLDRGTIDYFEQYGRGLEEAKGDPGGREIRGTTY